MTATRLLVIDDDAQFARFVAHVARRAGYDVRVAVQADEIWGRDDDDPDLVFLDLDLPGSDGLTLLREFAARSCRASIHVLSGADAKVLRAATQLARELALRVGEPLAKPIALADLQRVLENGHAEAPPAGAVSAPAAVHAELDAEELRAGIARGELFAVFQPILDLESLEPVGAEALVRWRHPRHGVVPPLRFVPLAESSGSASDLTEAVLRRALDFARRDPIAARTRPLSVSLNLAPMVLSDRHLPERLGDLLHASGVAPKRLVVEVTESAALANRVNVLEVLSRLTLRGVEVSIDDFGTGSSSLERLDLLPLSELKIERAFVSQVARRTESAQIVRSTIELAHRLGLRTVAEGIEDAATLRWLRDAGCETGQGFLFSKGLEPDEFEAWLEAWPERRRAIDTAARA